MNLKKNEGITLVALVVTIIILIILATISLNATLGEDGLIAKAKFAKTEQRAATVEQEVFTWKVAKEIEGYVTGEKVQERNELIDNQLERNLLTNEEAEDAKADGQVQIGSKLINYGEDTPTDPPPPPPAGDEPTTVTDAKSKKHTFESTTTLKDKEGKDVVIPGKFKIADDSGETVNDGIVIEDRVGNQFVWVPVDNISSMAKLQEDSATDWEGKLYNFKEDDTNGITSSELTSYGVKTTNRREPAIVTKYDGEEAIYKTKLGFESANDFKDQLQIDFNSMVASVNQYKGFYIGRYETSELGTNSPKVQKGKDPTEGMDWYTMYKNSQEVANEGLQEEETSSVTSSMIWGCQWDAVMNWFIDCGGDTAKYVTDSTGKGNYEGTQGDNNIAIRTGSNKDYAVNNIYDMAGNVNEWTLTTSNVFYRISRGGCYNDPNDHTTPASDIGNGIVPTATNHKSGSRVSLYVNL